MRLHCNKSLNSRLTLIVDPYYPCFLTPIQLNINNLLMIETYGFVNPQVEGPTVQDHRFPANMLFK